ncbi:hypothetical protein [Deinococcus sp.]|uniref:hypothetical protein n=1 Tax=Deinococcus sp. TaxID=47478 RepID=UPI002869EAD9|nr:hypothetical protein [Deinococcus sp.]
MPRMLDLRRRNALWERLRALSPGTAAFEDTLHDLSVLTGWHRARVLAALGLAESEVPTTLALPTRQS